MIVLDASMLILLAKIELLPLLMEKTLVVIPPEVQREALARPELYDAKIISVLLKDGKLGVLRPMQLQHQKALQSDFGVEAGEAQALLLAREKNAPLGTDDGVAIKAAKIMGIPFFTAIHVVIELYHKSRLSQEVALAKLERLGKLGRYSGQILEDARKDLRKAR